MDDIKVINSSSDNSIKSEKETEVSREAIDAALDAATGAYFDSTNCEELSEFKIRKQEIEKIHSEYIKKHPEIRDFLADYLQLLLHRKPDDVYSFTVEYFKP